MRERDVRKALKARIESYGGEIRAVSWLGRANAPDVLAGFPTNFGRPKHHVFVEAKRPGKDATEAQAREHERMRSWDCEVKVITTIEELDAWLPPLK
jgi:hypothetical protein